MTEPDMNDVAFNASFASAGSPTHFSALTIALLNGVIYRESGTDTRLVSSRDAIGELVRVFMPERNNEARLIDQIETHINRVVDLGFVRRLKSESGSASTPASFEVRRILRAFVDAQWLAEFDTRLALDRERLQQDDADGDRGVNKDE